MLACLKRRKQWAHVFVSMCACVCVWVFKHVGFATWKLNCLLSSADVTTLWGHGLIQEKNVSYGKPSKRACGSPTKREIIIDSKVIKFNSVHMFSPLEGYSMFEPFLLCKNELVWSHFSFQQFDKSLTTATGSNFSPSFWWQWFTCQGNL